MKNVKPPVFDKRADQHIAHSPGDSSNPEEIERFLKDIPWRLRIIKPKKFVEIKTFLYACDKIRPVGYSSMGDKHDFWEFTLVIKGSALEISDDRENIISEGMMVAHKPMEFHKTCQYGDNELEFMVASFEIAGDEMKYFEDKIFRLLPRQEELFKQAAGALAKYYSGIGSEKNLQKGISLFEGFLTDILVEKEKSDMENADSRFDDIVSVLNRNYNKKLTLEMLSAECNMSVSLMKKIFSKHSECGIMAYFNKIKAKRAAEFLELGYSLSEVAYMLGYSGSEYFNYCFRREMGITPLKYVKEYAKKK